MVEKKIHIHTKIPPSCFLVTSATFLEIKAAIAPCNFLESALHFYCGDIFPRTLGRLTQSLNKDRNISTHFLPILNQSKTVLQLFDQF